MGQYDFSCNVSASVTETNNSQYKVTVICYWKCNGWRYNMNGVSGWVTCNGTEINIANNISVNYQDNQGQYELGRHDFWIDRDRDWKSVSCSARLKSTSSYISGERWSGTVDVGIDGRTHTVIKYDANGGSGAPGNQDKWYGESLWLSSDRPYRAGYTFLRWNTQQGGGGTNYNPGNQYTSDPGGTVTLYAQWQINTWTVSYNANGGSGAPGNQTKTYNQNLILSSTKPTKTGYNFKGWATSSNGAVAYQPGGTYTGNSNLTLYAIWEIAYIKPRITGLKVFRCTSAGVSSESGTYLKYTFIWNTDKEISTITVQYKKQTDSNWLVTSVSNLSGTNRCG